MLAHGALVVLFADAKLRFIQRPAVFPVVHHGDLVFRRRAGNTAKVAQPLADLRHFLEDARMLAALVVDHRAVEFLALSATLAELEVLHAVGAVRDRLQALQRHRARAAQLVDLVPVDARGAGFHHQEGLAAAYAAHEIVLEGGILRHVYVLHRALPLGIVVPAAHVEHLAQIKVIDDRIGAHQIRGAGNVGRDALERLDFVQVKIDRLPGAEAPPGEL